MQAPIREALWDFVKIITVSTLTAGVIKIVLGTLSKPGEKRHATVD